MSKDEELRKITKLIHKDLEHNEEQVERMLGKFLDDRYDEVVEEFITELARFILDGYVVRKAPGKYSRTSKEYVEIH